MTNLAVKNEIQSRISNNSSIIGMEIVSIDGCGDRNGVIEGLSVESHSILGLLAFVWVRWDNGSLENYEPHQFEKYNENFHTVGVYYK